MNERPIRTEPTSPEPDIYEVLLIGGGNDGKRIAVPKEILKRWFDNGIPLQVPYVPSSEVMGFVELELVSNKSVHYIIEYYYPVQLFGHLTVARYDKLSLDRMYFQLVRKYKRDLEQTT